MILGSLKPREVGRTYDTYVNIPDVGFVAQPVFIIRQATMLEYIEWCKEMGASPDFASSTHYYYEVSTD
jgi:hypothetical protein